MVDASLIHSQTNVAKWQCTLATFHPDQRLDEAGNILMTLPKCAVSFIEKTFLCTLWSVCAY